MNSSSIKRIFSFLLCLIILACAVLPASAVTISDTVLGKDTDYVYGYYRKYVHWSVRKSEGILSIFGNEGEKYDDTIDSSFYYTHHIEPFAEYIKILSVEGKISSIEEGALAGLPFERAELGNGLKRIESEAFKDCDRLTKLVIPASVEYIGRGAFEGCESLERVYIFANNIVIDEGAFPDSLNVKSVYFYGDNIEIRSGNARFSDMINNFRENGSVPQMLIAAAAVAVVAAGFVLCIRFSKKEAKEKGKEPDQK